MYFSLYGCLEILHLHSFPTRRSSDLGAGAARGGARPVVGRGGARRRRGCAAGEMLGVTRDRVDLDRKSTRLNSSHGYISYAVFCLKKKKDAEIGARAEENRNGHGGDV